jgi:hypothetical protein
LIGIYGHVTDWARKEIPEIMARNWPDAGLVHELKHVVGAAPVFDDADRLALQKAGIAAEPVEADGKVYMTIGQSIGGTPYSASRLMMIVMHTFRDWREHLHDRLGDAATAVDAAAGHSVTGAWEPTVHDGWAGLRRGDAFYGIVEV